MITVGRRRGAVADAVIEAVESAGGDDGDVLRILKDGTLKRQIGLLFMGKLPLAPYPCQRIVPHLIPDWVKDVVEDVEPTVAEGSKLTFPSFLRDGDNGRIDGPTMRLRAKEMKANYGLSDVPILLGPDGKGLTTIPVEFRGKVHIALTATVLRHSDGRLYVPCLFWDDGAWVVGFHRLAFGWFGHDLLVSCE